MSPRGDNPIALLRDPGHLLSLGAGTGCAPIAPGTFGTLAGVLLYLPIKTLPLAGYVSLTLVLFILGIWLCGRTAAALGVHDHPAIVWDEVVGYLITMIAAPPGWVYLVLGFVLFRVFDILKPWPVRWLDRRVRGGVGIMLDDAAAALMAWACLQIIPFPL